MDARPILIWLLLTTVSIKVPRWNHGSAFSLRVYDQMSRRANVNIDPRSVKQGEESSTEPHQT